jgi:hypothetical protein
VQEFDSDPSTGLTIRLCRWQQCVCRFELIMRGVTCKLWRDKSGAFHSCFVEFGKLAPSFSIDVLCISVINFWKFDIYWMGGNRSVSGPVGLIRLSGSFYVFRVCGVIFNLESESG